MDTLVHSIQLLQVTDEDDKQGRSQDSLCSTPFFTGLHADYDLLTTTLSGWLSWQIFTVVAYPLTL